MRVEFEPDRKTSFTYKEITEGIGGRFYKTDSGQIYTTVWDRNGTAKVLVCLNNGLPYVVDYCGKTYAGVRVNEDTKFSLLKENAIKLFYSDKTDEEN